mmetsp:Transcript_41896/g.129516  ORF Transcript_41896/g.129516 Transcript_41896/m.129516 type:complete len:248 (-) Transcript_41896:682-1425(-)
MADADRTRHHLAARSVDASLVRHRSSVGFTSGFWEASVKSAVSVGGTSIGTPRRAARRLAASAMGQRAMSAKDSVVSSTYSPCMSCRSATATSSSSRAVLPSSSLRLASSSSAGSPAASSTTQWAFAHCKCDSGMSDDSALSSSIIMPLLASKMSRLLWLSRGKATSVRVRSSMSMSPMAAATHIRASEMLPGRTRTTGRGSEHVRPTVASSDRSVSNRDKRVSMNDMRFSASERNARRRGAATKGS